MKVIIAGGRDIIDASLIPMAVETSGFVVTEVVSGMQRGVDTLGKEWAERQGIPVQPFPPEYERYGVPAAFHIRNRAMAEYGEALILVWDGKSRGSASMLKEAGKKHLPTYEYVVR